MSKDIDKYKQKNLVKARGSKSSKEIKTEPLPIKGLNISVLAIDQGTTKTGFAFYKDNEIVEHGIVKPAGKTMLQKLISLENHLYSLYETYQPQLVVFEGEVGGFSSQAARTGVTVAQYLVDRTAHDKGIPRGSINAMLLKAQVVDKERLKELKDACLRSSMRPEKADVTHRVCTQWNKPIDGYFFSNDHSDAIALLIALFENNDILEIQK